MKPLFPSLARTADPRSAYAKRFIITLTVTLATVLLTLDSTIVSVAVPSMMGNLGATLDEIAWVSTGYILALVIVIPISGWLADWFGRRNYFAMCILFFTLSSLMCGWSSSLEELVFWRLVQGFAGGGLISNAQMAIMEVFPPTEVGKGMAIWGIGLMLGPTIGPPFGGWLTENLSWPWIFYVNLPMGALALLLALLYVPDSRFAKKPEKVDVIGLVLLVVGAGSLQALLERGQHLDWLASREIVAYCIACPVALALLVVHELRCAHPVIDVRAFANRQFSASMLLMMTVGFAGTSYIFAFPVMLQTIHGYGASEAGMGLLPFMIGNLLGFMLTGRVVSRPKIDLRWVLALYILLSVFGFWVHTRTTAQSSVSDFLIPQLILGLGGPMGLLTLTTLGTVTLRREQVAGANSLINFSRQIGGSLGIALYATLLSHFHATSRGELIRHINSFTEAATERLDLFQNFLISKGTPLTVVPQKALLLLDKEVSREAMVIAFDQSMAMYAMIMLFCFLAVALLTTGQNVPKAETAH